jgi:hypothetical protein
MLEVVAVVQEIIIQIQVEIQEYLDREELEIQVDLVVMLLVE